MSVARTKCAGYNEWTSPRAASRDNRMGGGLRFAALRRGCGVRFFMHSQRCVPRGRAGAGTVDLPTLITCRVLLPVNRPRHGLRSAVRAQVAARPCG